MSRVGTSGDSLPNGVGRVSSKESSGGIDLLVRCDCGFEARGTEVTLVPAVQRHGREAHNMEVTREEVLAMAKPAEPGA